MLLESASRTVAANSGDPQNHKTDHRRRVLDSVPRDSNPAGPEICILYFPGDLASGAQSKHVLGTVASNAIGTSTSPTQTHAQIPAPRRPTQQPGHAARHRSSGLRNAWAPPPDFCSLLSARPCFPFMPCTRTSAVLERRGKKEFISTWDSKCEGSWSPG